MWQPRTACIVYTCPEQSEIFFARKNVKTANCINFERILLIFKVGSRPVCLCSIKIENPLLVDPETMYILILIRPFIILISPTIFCAQWFQLLILSIVSYCQNFSSHFFLSNMSIFIDKIGLASCTFGQFIISGASPYWNLAHVLDYFVFSGQFQPLHDIRVCTRWGNVLTP
jgi:hypothetical protein